MAERVSAWHPEYDEVGASEFREMARRRRSDDGRWPNEPSARSDDDPNAGVREPRGPKPEPLPDAAAFEGEGQN
jgi:hypothetical protein